MPSEWLSKLLLPESSGRWTIPPAAHALTSLVYRAAPLFSALSRLETMVSMAGLDLPIKALRQQFASAIDMIVQVSRLTGGPRRVLAVSEVLNMEQDTIVMQDVFTFQQMGVSEDGIAHGQFMATGVRPQFMDRLASAGQSLPGTLFHPRVLGKG